MSQKMIEARVAVIAPIIERLIPLEDRCPDGPSPRARITAMEIVGVDLITPVARSLYMSVLNVRRVHVLRGQHDEYRQCKDDKRADMLLPEIQHLEDEIEAALRSYIEGRIIQPGELAQAS